MTTPAAPSERTTIRRLPDRGHYDPTTVEAILDEALFCHLGLVDPEGRPFVIPTIHARSGRSLYVHGSPASRALRSAAGVDACVVVTIVDGLVLARSAFHHSMNYRSVVVYGRAERVEDPDEKIAALETIVEHVVAGRAGGTRAPNAKEVRGTVVLRLPLDEASAKIRTGGPLDDPEDMDLPVWAGVVPLRLVPGAPEPATDLCAGAPPWPGYELGRAAKSP